jgi:hypothetical protein
MMQLICPNCGEQIPSQHINIHQMVAVCPACDTVFRFMPPIPKAKRRKVKAPDRLNLDETGDQVHMAFRTNFRLDKDEGFISSAIFSLVFTFITALFVTIFLMEEVPLLLLMALGAAMASLLGYYRVALVAYNQTHIDMTGDTITVSRQPIANVFMPPTRISLAGITRFHYEETPTSQKEGYDTPRYGVWAILGDGGRRLIVNDVVVDYAAFIAQQLNEYLLFDASPDTDRLSADEDEAETVITEDSTPQARANRG